MTADQCEACPFADQAAALELVRLREGIGRLASEWERVAPMLSEPSREDFTNCAADLRALLDDNEGEIA
jgi:hypothetical protein